VLDVFSGAGGLSVGFAMAGFEVVAGLEWDADAVATFKRIHPHAKVHEEDARSFAFSQYSSRASIVVGGPPCQPWSVGGLRLGEHDPRDGIPDFIRAVREVAPLAFVMENVAGVACSIARSRFDLVVDQLAEAGGGYRVDWRVLEAADYGVPQARKRLVVVGTRPELIFRWPEPSRGLAGQRPHRTAGELVGPLPHGQPNPSIVTYAKRPCLRPDPYHGHLWNGGGRPLNLAKPSPTLLASMGGNKTPWVDTCGIVPDYHAHLCSGGEPRSGAVPGGRRLTVEEAALLQGFPGDIRFAGARSSQYRQVGNAVPPPLAEAVARALVRCIR
jgi:DNA (cytosine-5)-methyltransferase 1